MTGSTDALQCGGCSLRTDPGKGAADNPQIWFCEGLTISSDLSFKLLLVDEPPVQPIVLRS
ncbi:hypothetical protein [Rhizobium sp. PP-F2F-G48]|uniref:hypothetical protein n=1 Tax=Rhizobium sp. PP-F2F-G48 TaxID=2135651 RepID=UPI00104A7E42|nr:hypothetical protein [Rhizobium sp. PP-F2F-G48]